MVQESKADLQFIKYLMTINEPRNKNEVDFEIIKEDMEDVLKVLDKKVKTTPKLIHLRSIKQHDDMKKKHKNSSTDRTVDNVKPGMSTNNNNNENNNEGQIMNNQVLNTIIETTKHGANKTTGGKNEDMDDADNEESERVKILNDTTTNMDNNNKDNLTSGKKLLIKVSRPNLDMKSTRGSVVIHPVQGCKDARHKHKIQGDEAVHSSSSSPFISVNFPTVDRKAKQINEKIVYSDIQSGRTWFLCL